MTLITNFQQNQQRLLYIKQYEYEMAKRNTKRTNIELKRPKTTYHHLFIYENMWNTKVH
jgi:hypothetical protein